MAVRLGQFREHGFDQPLGLLSDCHRRIENFLAGLLRIATEARGQQLTAQHREALEAGLKYFREAAPKHTQDEESSLFPRMRDAASHEAKEALAKLEALEADHLKADRAHAEVESLGQKWLTQGALDRVESDRLAALLQELTQLYQRHIAVEDNEVFPLAGRVLNKDALKQVGQEMARRRSKALP